MRFLLIIAVIFLRCNVSMADASQPSIIRDAEIESVLGDIINPLAESAGMHSGAIKFHIIQDNSLNAFVSGGLQLYIHTGLLAKYENINILQGVLAHEIGHIIAGHLARAGEQGERDSNIVLGSILLGLGAAIAGSTDVGQAAVMGGMQVAQQNSLSYSRTQERSADQIGLELLDKTRHSAAGLMLLLNDLEREEKLYIDPNDLRKSKYLMTHPLASDRTQHISEHVKIRKTGFLSNDKLQIRFKRAVVKIRAFLDPPTETLAHYPLGNSDIALYARAIAFHRNFEEKNSTAALEELLIKTPHDPYLHELKAQFLYEVGKPLEAYKELFLAIQYNKNIANRALMQIDLANSAIAAREKSLFAEALTHLEHARIYESDNPLLWHSFAGIYTAIDKQSHATLALAEEALARGDTCRARKLAIASQKTLSGADAVRAKDIEATTKPKTGKCDEK